MVIQAVPPPHAASFIITFSSPSLSFLSSVINPSSNFFDPSTAPFPLPRPTHLLLYRLRIHHFHPRDSFLKILKGLLKKNNHEIIMAEEHGFQAPEGHRMCVNNCGFFGSPATKNMCSKCYGDLCLKKSGDSSPIFSTPLPSAPSPSVAVVHTSPSAALEEGIREVTTACPPYQPPTNRCFSCRKKVGLTAFRCRCGSTFCGTHRYPEKHGCSFDFKAVGREAIAKANPVIRAEKLQKM